MKKILLVLSAVFMSFSVFSVPLSAEEGTGEISEDSELLNGTYGDLSYTIQNGEVTITDCAWEAVSVVIPDTIEGYPVTEIGDAAFRSRENLTDISIPESVTRIGKYAFQSSKKLTGIEIPRSVTEIGEEAFLSCSGLTRIVIPNGITAIERATFEFCSGLTEVTIPDTVVTIGDAAFEYCYQLPSIRIPDSVKSVGYQAFDSCTSLAEVVLSKNMTSIGSGVFKGCTSLASIQIPEGITYIANSAFSGCSSLADISIPYGASSINSETFLNCTSLKNITIPETVQYIYDDAFNGCTSLETITGIENVIYLGDGALQNTKVKNLIFARGVVLSQNSVRNNSGVEEFKAVTGETIGSYCFRNCTSLKTIWIDHRVKTVETGAFQNCSQLETVYFHGTEEEWNRISVSSNNEPLQQADVIYLKPADTVLINNKAVKDNDTLQIELEAGSEKQLKVSYRPADAYTEDMSVEWNVTGEGGSYISVDPDGTITAIKEGTAYLYVTVEDRLSRSKTNVNVYVYVKPEDKVKSFVRRLYKLCFNREADDGGLNGWTDKLKSGRSTAANVVQAFFTSREMQNLKLSNEEFTERCYLVMMGRPSDAGGKKGWVDKLNAGVSYNYVLKGFVGSREFAKICKDYGITVGTINLTEPRDQNLGITQFVSRCYSEVLGRNADTGGLNNWCNKILTAADKKQAAINMASTGFFHSREYLNKNTSNDEYVKTLYRTFLGREADTGGYNNWMNKLNSGTSRDSVLMGFANSAEFANIMAKYGIR